MDTFAERSLSASEQQFAVPRLYCPEVIRDDAELGDEVTGRLVAWAEETGIYPGRADQVRAADFGRLIMLIHPSCDDPDRLLAAGKCALAGWAMDDYYCDDEQLGADPRLLASRLTPLMNVLDPVVLPARYQSRIERAIQDEPILSALRGAMTHLSCYASPAQMSRWVLEMAELYVSFATEADWRINRRVPSTTEYMMARELNGFVQCIAVLDVVGDYELPAGEYGRPDVRRVVKAANLAGTLVNDLFSADKEAREPGVGFTLPALIAAEEKCSPEVAMQRSVAIHDELVRTVEAETTIINSSASPELRRFLAGLWSWLAGHHAWHRGSARYRDRSVLADAAIGEKRL